MMPRISVIVPVYCAEKYLHNCIDSILGQTFREFELILVDDGSPDSCGAICDEYAQKDSRVRVFHQKNQGQAAARNRAVEESRGEWIHFVDSDDMIHSEMLKTLYDAAINNEVDISMCYALEGENITEEFGLKRDYRIRIISSEERDFFELIEKGEHQFWIAWAKLIRKEIVQKHRFCEGRIYEDNAIVHRWLYEAGNSAIVDSRLYFYRINPTGTTKQAFNIHQLDYLWALREIICSFAEYRYPILRKYFCGLYMSSSWHNYNRIKNTSFEKDGNRIIRTGLRSVVLKNYRHISLTKEERIAVSAILHPRVTQLYWLSKTALETLKQEGLSPVVKRILIWIKKRCHK